MNWIKIKNTGEIEPEAITLVGASSKRNDKSKIGMFGSGNKYALAFLLRSGYQVKLFAGEKEIVITTVKKTFRETDFDVICINGQETSITTEMGKDWKYWQAMRELYCNAIDEGGNSMSVVDEIEPKAGQTHFYIDNKRDSTEFFSNFDNYFATKKKVLFECSVGRIIEKSGTKCNIYRKGIRCFNSDKISVYDYDFNEISINEDRLVEYTWTIEEKMWQLIFQCDQEDIIKQILLNADNSEFIEGSLSSISSISSANASEVFMKYLRSINVAPSGYAGLLKPDEIHNHVILPTKIYNAVRPLLDDENVGDKFKIGKRGGMFREIEKNALQEATIQKALEFFKEVDFDMPYQVELVIFDNKDILGSIHGEIVLVSDTCVERGINEVVNTIIEEYIHIKYGVHDETRAFQTAIITEFISYLKKKNAYLL